METKDTLSSCSNSEEQQMQQIQGQAKTSCMVSFRQLHSHLKLLSNNDLKGTRTEYGFKRAFATLFGQDVETFTGTMFLNMDQLEKQLDNEEFQEIGSMAAFKVLETQFQMFIKSRIYLDDEYVTTCLVDPESSGTESKEQDTSSRSENDAHADDADIKPIYDEEPMAETEFERYKAFNDRTVDYDKLEHKLNKTLGLLAQKEIDIKEVENLKPMELSVAKEKTHELDKQVFNNSHYEGRLSKEKTKAQNEKPCLYEIPHDQSDPANRFVPDREEILTLEEESRSKLNKDLVKPFDYTKLNSLYEIFKPPTQEYQIQLAHANEIRKKMWRKSFVKMKPNIFKNIAFLPVSKSISKSRQAHNVMTNNINHLRELFDQAWVKHSKDHFRAPTAKDMKILIKTCLMPLALKTQNDSFTFIHELKKEMHADLKYVESLENEID
ncbi:hypothetical protein Tco_1124487 [Tanacetum coccineum]|uniref:Uncharacterized protein n=1 Tax=Tanacetum coccineum TaxID=301880 RepID=A0ABQ5J930_9ASTR